MRIGVGRPSLSRRIVASVALGLTLILLLFGVVALWTFQESTQAAYGERVTLAQMLSARVDDELRYALVTLDREAAELRIAPRRPLTEDQRQALTDLRFRLGTFAIISVTDAAGTTIWTDPIRADVVIGSPLNHPSVGIVLRTGEPSITDLPSIAEPETVFACLAVPLHDPDGHLAGVLMAELDPRHPAMNLLPSGEVGAGILVQLMNTSGWLLAGTEGFSPQAARQHGELLADLIAARTPGYRIHEPPTGAQLSSHIVAYSPLSLLPSWGVFVEQPRDTVLAIPRQFQQRLGLFGLAALLLAVGVAWLDARRVVRPLQQLTGAAERFAAGQLDQPVALDRGDELGILARAFETMRQRLRASLAEVAAWNRELEQRVAARTAEVEHLYESLQARDRERAELLQRLIAGQEEERRRLAQELHDEASQALASLRLGLERLATGIEGSERGRQLAGQLQSVAAQTLAAVHRLAVELRPSILDDVGLVAAIERYLQESAQQWNLAVDFATMGIDGDFRLIPAAETTIYRIVQAALTNIAHHAEPRHVSVLLERRDQKLVVVVEDDGQGFDLAAVRARPLEKRLGLAGMEERGSLIGATLTIETAPGAGTTMFLEVPLDANWRKEEANVEVTHPVG